MKLQELASYEAIVGEDYFLKSERETAKFYRSRAKRLMNVGLSDKASAAASVAAKYEKYCSNFDGIREVERIQGVAFANTSYVRAASKGDARSLERLAVQGPFIKIAYQESDGSVRIKDRRNVFFVQALKQQLPAALFAQSIVLDSQGKIDQAQEYLEKSATDGCPEALAEVIYQKMEQDELEVADELLKVLLRTHDADSIVLTAMRYGEYGCLEVCLKMLKLARKLGGLDASVLLGQISWISDDEYSAYAYWKEAANKDHPAAIYLLANPSWDCPPLVPLTDPEQVGLLHRAARLGSKEAHELLTRHYIAVGCPTDIAVPSHGLLERWIGKYPDYSIDFLSDDKADLVATYWFKKGLKGVIPALVAITYYFFEENTPCPLGGNLVLTMLDNVLHTSAAGASEAIRLAEMFELDELEWLRNRARELYPETL